MDRRHTSHRTDYRDLGERVQAVITTLGNSGSPGNGPPTDGPYERTAINPNPYRRLVVSETRSVRGAIAVKVSIRKKDMI